MGYIRELRNLVGNRPLIMTGANVILLDKENKLLLQLRTDNKCWGLAGGALEPGETLEEVAKRELYEETNLVANKLTLFNVYSGKEFYYKYPHGDEVYNVISTYICTDYEGVLKKDEDEVLDLQFFHYDNLPAELNPPEIPIITEFINTFFFKEN
ncbi:NUDIX hydrolase [Sporosarcina limicola]|uniref:8-oxo-dGTP pyrophosphatase MutT (NUDIX family) n=1 Tax=Sporosarcina limicola TaxID=34101 RepID=A0A927RCB9_9BACL|nr:NUDIX hydrolase [Sporosarcina limicola]MBE1554205.1 8-oxo-dGTP pyrophosphatase MutT (NUDIX family) [Sporosarcina limicola]